MKAKIYIDPLSKISYSSYYIRGFYDVFGKGNVTFSSKYFKELDKKGEAWSFDSYMAVVLVTKNIIHKIIIDFGDDIPIRKNAYSWCNIYAKINYFPGKSPESLQEKIISITPGFAIKIWNGAESFYYALKNLIMVKFKPQCSLKNHFISYFSQLKAKELKKFLPQQNQSSENKYVFFVSTLWPHQNCQEGTNLYRKNFMESCIKSGTDFEGGFLLINPDHPQKEEFGNLMLPKRIPFSEFILKSKKSLTVFNTPSVHQCHGWKLGQYLAMGKAIISMPLQNQLPELLRHGENIHFIAGAEDIDNAVEIMINDKNYRNKLEDGAKRYFKKNASPASVIESIVVKLGLEI